MNILKKINSKSSFFTYFVASSVCFKRRSLSKRECCLGHTLSGSEGPETAVLSTTVDQPGFRFTKHTTAEIGDDLQNSAGNDVLQLPTAETSES